MFDGALVDFHSVYQQVSHDPEADHEPLWQDYGEQGNMILFSNIRGNMPHTRGKDNAELVENFEDFVLSYTTTIVIIYLP